MLQTEHRAVGWLSIPPSLVAGRVQDAVSWISCTETAPPSLRKCRISHSFSILLYLVPAHPRCWCTDTAELCWVSCQGCWAAGQCPVPQVTSCPTANAPTVNNQGQWGLWGGEVALYQDCSLYLKRQRDNSALWDGVWLHGAERMSEERLARLGLCRLAHDNIIASVIRCRVKNAERGWF